MSIYDPLAHLGVPVPVQATVLAAGLLIFMGTLIRKQIMAANGGAIPDEGLSIRNLLEVVVDYLSTLAEENMGEDWRRWFPLIGTIFFFILISNLLGLVPGVGGATSFVEVTTAWAIISFLLSEYAGIEKHGAQYIKHFMGPVWWLVPVFVVLEIPLHFARILTLSVRLLANMFADHTIVGVWIGLVPIAIPAIFMGLGTVVAFLQAFVFSLLTMVYIGMALEEAH